MLRSTLITALCLAATLGSAGFEASAASVTVTVLGSNKNPAPDNVPSVFASGFGAFTPIGAAWSDDPTVVAPPSNSPGNFVSPFGGTSDIDYFAVGGVDGTNGAPSPQSLSFDTAQSSFQILWGSIDSYNTLSFFDGADLVEDFTGTDLVTLGLIPGTASPKTVALLAFDFGAHTFDRIEFKSPQAAFEFALAPVPLPAAAWMLIAGVGGLVAVSRRRRAAA